MIYYVIMDNNFMTDIFYRLGVAWLILYKDAVESYRLGRYELRTATEAGDLGVKGSRSELKKTKSLIVLLQSKIHALGLTLPPRAKRHLADGERTSLLLPFKIIVSKARCCTIII